MGKIYSIRSDVSSFFKDYIKINSSTLIPFAKSHHKMTLISHLKGGDGIFPGRKCECHGIASIFSGLKCYRKFLGTMIKKKCNILLIWN